MRKLKIGQKVRLRKDIKFGKLYTCTTFHDFMRSSNIVVSYFYDTEPAFRATNGWAYSFDMIQPRPTNSLLNYL